ncbi:transcription factor Adf-1-like [Macrosteles quadrilineatus]|uniref:transcription factor Adf-1-like n=1 Tax=Macrosteles quadrilineatus TaxID=74068 RepID=UPI0023E0DAE6|nr:transcription factor Adf-1-like [Macrosteles quadrilineatus]
MEWSEENALLLIAEYKDRPILWDLSHPLHFHKVKRRDAWNEISAVIGRPPTELKKKWDNLLASFRRERTKVTKVETGKDADGAHYAGSWYAFEAMRFTMEKNKPKSVLNTG